MIFKYMVDHVRISFNKFLIESKPLPIKPDGTKSPQRFEEVLRNGLKREDLKVQQGCICHREKRCFSKKFSISAARC